MSFNKIDLIAYAVALIFVSVLMAFALTVKADNEKTINIPEVEKIKVCWDTKILFILPSKDCKLVETDELIAWVDENGEAIKPKPLPPIPNHRVTPAE